MKYLRTPLALLFAMAALFAACGDDGGGDTPSRDALVDELAKTLESDADLSEEDSQCVAASIVDDIGIDKLIEAGLQSGGDIEDLDSDTQDQIFDATFAAFESCNVDISAN